MAFVLATGWEHGHTGSLTAGVAAGRFATGAGTAQTVVAAAARTGGYGLRCNSTSATAYNNFTSDQLGGGATCFVVHAAIRLNTIAVNADLLLLQPTTGTVYGVVSYDNASGRFKLRFDGTGTEVLGPSAPTGSFYIIELFMDVSTTTWELRWRVNGVTYTTIQLAGQSANTMTAVRAGWATALTASADVDDLVIWNSAADWTDATPLNHKVVQLGPIATVIVIGTSGAVTRFLSNATPDATFSAANVLGAINEVPPLTGGTATGLAQRTAGTGNGLAIPMGSYTLGTGETIGGVRIEVVTWANSATAAANTLGVRAFDGNAETTLFTAAAYDGVNTANPSMICKPYTPSGGWDQTKLNALRVRIGYSASISPLPGAHAIYAEVAVRELSLPRPYLRRTAHPKFRR